MHGYLVSRLAQTALVVFLSLTAVFFLVRLSGDPVLLFLPMDIQAKDVDAIRQQMGFNDPLLVQYARYMRGALHGDFGESLRYRRDALGLVLERLPATLLLAGSAILLTLVIAVPLGVFLLPRTPIFGGTKHWMTAYPAMCIIAGRGFEGWIQQVRLWGVYPNEKVD